MNDIIYFGTVCALYLACVWTKMLLNDLRNKRRLKREREADKEHEERLAKLRKEGKIK